MRRLLFALVLLVAAPAAASDWIESLDIPLMPGLSLTPDSETVFETADARIVELEARGAVAPEDVRRYYASALAGLGWQGDPVSGMMRDGERLRLEIAGGGATTVVAFRLTPQRP
ncbi:MAG: hypothetical protein ACMVY4_20760 [Minwuia sp.]|uniref:hypothetical protein n=1 Tax=Minwuia sp. TaxID=2493630 RepID=UPI003A874A98